VIIFYVKAYDGEFYTFNNFESEFVPRVGEKVELEYFKFDSIKFRVTEISYLFHKNKCISVSITGEESEVDYEFRFNVNSYKIPEKFNLRSKTNAT
jgi:hypothetical protein